MKFIAALALCALFSAPSFAKEVTVTLTDQEQTSLSGMLDLALKTQGLPALPTVNYWENKLAEATKKADEKTVHTNGIKTPIAPSSKAPMH